MNPRPLGWAGIVRLGLVQAALGAVVVLVTSTMNRVMVIEAGLPAALPAALVMLHYLVQVVRPRFGFGSDVGGRCRPWIVGGMAVLGLGAVLAALAIDVMTGSRIAGLALALLAFLLIGGGVGAAGTSLLVLLTKRVAERRRAAAATIVWVMMIFGFVLCTAIVGRILEPYSAQRLLAITGAVALIALAISLLATIGIESRGGIANASALPARRPEAGSFRRALAEIWNEPRARRFTIFVFVSMLAYSGQELILEPFAGAVFAMTPGATTQLSSLQHGGVLSGMLLVALICSGIGGRRLGSLRGWTIFGCFASATSLLGLCAAGLFAPAWPLKANAFLLGFANGIFAVSAISSMMGLAGQGREAREGTRMGLWGAAQAVAFGFGGFIGASASDVARHFVASTGLAYSLVFGIEASLFLLAAVIAARLDSPTRVAAARTPSRMQTSESRA